MNSVHALYRPFVTRGTRFVTALGADQDHVQKTIFRALQKMSDKKSGGFQLAQRRLFCKDRKRVEHVQKKPANIFSVERSRIRNSRGEHAVAEQALQHADQCGAYAFK